MQYAGGTIKLFGGLQILNSDSTHVHISGRRERDLIIALALDQGQAVSRDSLTTRIWDRDDFQARKTLNTALWRLRNSIREAGLDCEDWFETGSDYIRLREKRGPVVDYTQISQGLKGFQKGSLSIKDMIGRLRLADGAFLEGLDIEWLEERKRVAQREALCAFLAVIEALGDNDIEQIIEFAQRAVIIDPYEERAWRAMLEAYLHSGQQAQAHASYQRLCEIFKLELGIKPSQETQSIFHFIDTNVTQDLAQSPQNALSLDPKLLSARIESLSDSLAVILSELEGIKDELQKL